MNAVPTLRWLGDRHGYLQLIDQTRLPGELVQVDCHDVATVRQAIRTLQVRGAPAIGIAAAYGLLLELSDLTEDTTFFLRLAAAREALISSRPTAVNLAWAVQRVYDVAERMRGQNLRADIHEALWREARAIHEEDRAICRAIGAVGAPLLANVSGVLTHCNAGGLATSEYGTALAAIFTAHEQGHALEVYVDETRPLLQGARLTAWELLRCGIPATLICDSMAAQVMREGRVQCVIVGADRIAANGDTANKIGTYGLALLAHAHALPFLVAAPASTFDLSLANGDEIPIEQRPAEEITHGFGRRTAPEGISVYNPAFDVTPARLIHAIITEHGLIRPVSEHNVRQTLGKNR